MAQDGSVVLERAVLQVVQWLRKVPQCWRGSSCRLSSGSGRFRSVGGGCLAGCPVAQEGSMVLERAILQVVQWLRRALYCCSGLSPRWSSGSGGFHSVGGCCPADCPVAQEGSMVLEGGILQVVQWFRRILRC